MAHDPLVSPDWLQAHLDDPGVRVVDIRGYVVTRPLEPGVEEAEYLDATDDYRASHIPGAVYIDWTEDIVDWDDPVPVQIAPPERFAEVMAERGIGDATHVVAVDHFGGQFATRLWWALTYYGHDAVSVLDGGWDRWVEEGRPVASGVVSVAPAVFTPQPRFERRATAEQVLGQLGRDDVQLIDARDNYQYTGQRRRGPRGGHIPGAVNLPRSLFFAEDLRGFRPLEEIAQKLEAHGVTPDQPAIAYCNGGVAATVVLFHMARLGFPDLILYDGSWNEWGPRQDLPAATHEPRHGHGG